MLKLSYKSISKAGQGCLVNSRWLYLAARWSVSLLFIYAGAVKLVDPKAFARTISAYGLLPDELLVPVAVGLPTVELLAGLGLLFNLKGSLKVITSLVLLFMGVLGYAIISELNVDCGCFSSSELDARKSLRAAFYRDIGLMLTLAYLYKWEKDKRNGLRTFADSRQEDFGR